MIDLIQCLELLPRHPPPWKVSLERQGWDRHPGLSLFPKPCAPHHRAFLSSRIKDSCRPSLLPTQALRTASSDVWATLSAIPVSPMESGIPLNLPTSFSKPFLFLLCHTFFKTISLKIYDTQCDSKLANICKRTSPLPILKKSLLAAAVSISH